MWPPPKPSLGSNVSRPARERNRERGRKGERERELARISRCKAFALHDCYPRYDRIVSKPSSSLVFQIGFFYTYDSDFFDFLNTGLRCRPFILIQVEFDISFAWKTINQSIFDIFSFSLVYIFIRERVYHIAFSLLHQALTGRINIFISVYERFLLNDKLDNSK